MKKHFKVNKAFKNGLNKPLYKPLKVEGPDGIDFNESLIETCHLLHKSFIGLLNVNHDLKLDKVEMDWIANDHSDFTSAAILNLYFHQWIKDVKELQRMAGDQ